MPAQAGIQKYPLSGRLHPTPSQRAEARGWIPACAGMTTGERPEATEPAPAKAGDNDCVTSLSKIKSMNACKDRASYLISVCRILLLSGSKLFRPEPIGYQSPITSFFQCEYVWIR